MSWSPFLVFSGHVVQAHCGEAFQLLSGQEDRGQAEVRRQGPQDAAGPGGEREAGEGEAAEGGGGADEAGEKEDHTKGTFIVGN